jgi:hypothetical protein
VKNARTLYLPHLPPDFSLVQKKTIKFSGKMREFWGQNRRMGKEKQVGAGAKGAQKQKTGLFVQTFNPLSIHNHFDTSNHSHGPPLDSPL